MIWLVLIAGLGVAAWGFVRTARCAAASEGAPKRLHR